VITTKVITPAEGDQAKNGAPAVESDHGGPKVIMPSGIRLEND
jgi:hypothetical protein